MSCGHELANEWARGSGKHASYITKLIIPRARVNKSLAMPRGTTRLIGSNHLISNEREWDDCFIKNALQSIETKVQ